MLFGGPANPIPLHTYQKMCKLYKNPLLAKDPKLSDPSQQKTYELIAGKMIKMQKQTVDWHDGGKVRAGFHTKLTRYHVIYPSCGNMRIQRPADETFWPFAEGNCFEHSDSFIGDKAANKWTFAPRPQLEHFDEPFENKFNAVIAVRFLKLLDEGDRLHRLTYDLPGCYPEPYDPTGKTYKPAPDEDKENKRNGSDSSDSSESNASTVAGGRREKETKKKEGKRESEHKDLDNSSDDDDSEENASEYEGSEAENSGEEVDPTGKDKAKDDSTKKKKNDPKKKPEGGKPDHEVATTNTPITTTTAPDTTKEPKRKPAIKRKPKKDDDGTWKESGEDDDDDEAEEGVKKPANKKKVSFKEKENSKETKKTGGTDEGKPTEPPKSTDTNLTVETATKEDPKGDKKSEVATNKKTENKVTGEDLKKKGMTSDRESDESDEPDKEDGTLDDEDSEFTEPAPKKKSNKETATTGRKPTAEEGKLKPSPTGKKTSADKTGKRDKPDSNSEDDLSEMFTEMSPKRPTTRRRPKRGKGEPKFPGLRRAVTSQLDEVGSGLRLYRALARSDESALLTTEEMEQLNFLATNQTLEEIFDGWAQTQVRDDNFAE
ncbi:uncharacterized protein DFL_001549 [Arthrobotrys flagrans]|uniref:Uncharacterized protein n=1 Tax=Arthrobotrys flagrans TaxID=97331 RepID=A0A437A840_ARTFL|nr:hypothetical protein DFL_001549 [Arthrobotrys flagrans]